MRLERTRRHIHVPVLTDLRCHIQRHSQEPVRCVFITAHLSSGAVPTPVCDPRVNMQGSEKQDGQCPKANPLLGRRRKGTEMYFAAREGSLHMAALHSPNGPAMGIQTPQPQVGKPRPRQVTWLVQTTWMEKEPNQIESRKSPRFHCPLSGSQ